jgi:plasmid stabilization system protein ParE
MKIIWTEFAIAELKSIFEYYKTNANITIARRIKSEVFTAAKSLSKQALMGQVEENLVELNQKHRCIVEGNYKIIYIVVDDVIYITDVFDCRQNPDKMKRK